MYTIDANKRPAWRRSLWIGWTILSIGLLSWIAFFWIGYRARQRKWFLWGLVYSLPFVMAMSSGVVNYPSELSGLVLVSIWIMSSIHAFIARKEYIIRLDALQALKIREEMDLRVRALREYGLVNQPQSPASVAQLRITPAVLEPKPVRPAQTTPASAVAFSPSSPTSKQPLIYVNRASEAAIASLPGVGPILAKKAVAEREMRGGFRSVEEFGEALGLKPHIVERLRPLVVITPGDEQKAATGGRLVDF
ncbi:MAG: hypothetical protein C4291_14345 [Candidatus Dadabacteria bacterium]